MIFDPGDRIGGHSVFCFSPHSLHVYCTRDCPGAAETRFGAPHFPHLASMRVWPCLMVTVFRSSASLTRRSVSSRIACFDISGFLASRLAGPKWECGPRQRTFSARRLPPLIIPKRSDPDMKADSRRPFRLVYRRPLHSPMFFFDRIGRCCPRPRMSVRHTPDYVILLGVHVECTQATMRHVRVPTNDGATIPG